jgi:uncharacterized repeat protein (TIGR01451 family)
MAANAATQVVITAELPASLAVKQITNTAKVSGAEPETTLTNNQDSVTVTIGTPPSPRPGPPTPPRPPRPGGGSSLRITKSASTTQPALGVPFDYRIRVQNSGPGTATNVAVVEPLAASLTLLSATPSQGRCVGRRVIACNLGTLGPRATATVIVRVVATRAGVLRNTATADSRETPAVSDEATVRVRMPVATVVFTKRADRPVVGAGQLLRFDLTLRVNGRAAQDVEICDNLPDGMSVLEAPGGQFRDGRPCWSWTYLAGDATRHIRVVVRIAPGTTARILTNRASVLAANVRRDTVAAAVHVLARKPRAGGVTG